jgi:hypothetical protein
VAWAVIYTGLFSIASGLHFKPSGRKKLPPRMRPYCSAWKRCLLRFGWLLLNELLSLGSVGRVHADAGGMLLAQWRGRREAELSEGNG